MDRRSLEPPDSAECAALTGGRLSAAAAGATVAATSIRWTGATNRYPRRATVRMYVGDEGSSPSVSRSSDTACASALSVTLAPGQTPSSSASLVTSSLGPLNEIKEQVEQLRREVEHALALEHAVGGPIGQEWAEAVGHGVGFYSLTTVNGRLMMAPMRETHPRLLVSAVMALALAQGPAASQMQEWPVAAGDAAASHYSALTDIDRESVRRLAVAWEWRTGDETMTAPAGARPGNFQNTPLMIDNVLYVSTPYNRVVALDAETGSQMWAYDPKAYEDGQPPNGTGFVHRGVAAWRDAGTLRIFMNSRAHLICLDAKTGAPVESFGTHGVVDLTTGLRWPVDPKRYTNTSPPVVYKDLVILGNGVGDRMTYRQDPPGDVRAFDARTGKQVWSFHTVPGAGEPGVETWGDESWKITGHTNVWAPMSLDERRGLVFLPVSTPSNDFYGARRPGANLYGESIVCLDAATGVRKWHFQIVHHGLWDYDPASAPSLVTMSVGGRQIDGVVQLTKQGFAFVFDRVTGKPVWPIEERPVPQSDVAGEHAWPTQPFPTRPGGDRAAGRHARRRVRPHAGVESGRAGGTEEIPVRARCTRRRRCKGR